MRGRARALRDRAAAVIGSAGGAGNNDGRQDELTGEIHADLTPFPSGCYLPGGQSNRSIANSYGTSSGTPLARGRDNPETARPQKHGGRPELPSRRGTSWCLSRRCRGWTGSRRHRCGWSCRAESIGQDTHSKKRLSLVSNYGLLLPMTAPPMLEPFWAGRRADAFDETCR
jgi:hypothetical protein